MHQVNPKLLASFLKASTGEGQNAPAAGDENPTEGGERSAIAGPPFALGPRPAGLRVKNLLKG